MTLGARSELFSMRPRSFASSPLPDTYLGSGPLVYVREVTLEPRVERATNSHDDDDRRRRLCAPEPSRELELEPSLAHRLTDSSASFVPIQLVYWLFALSPRACPCCCCCCRRSVAMWKCAQPPRSACPCSTPTLRPSGSLIDHHRLDQTRRGRAERAERRLLLCSQELSQCLATIKRASLLCLALGASRLASLRVQSRFSRLWVSASEASSARTPRGPPPLAGRKWLGRRRENTLEIRLSWAARAQEECL